MELRAESPFLEILRMVLLSRHGCGFVLAT